MLDSDFANIPEVLISAYDIRDGAAWAMAHEWLAFSEAFRENNPPATDAAVPGYVSYWVHGLSVFSVWPAFAGFW